MIRPGAGSFMCLHGKCCFDLGCVLGGVPSAGCLGAALLSDRMNSVYITGKACRVLGKAGRFLKRGVRVHDCGNRRCKGCGTLVRTLLCVL